MKQQWKNHKPLLAALATLVVLLAGVGVFAAGGQRQHGLPTLKIADLACDMQLLEEAQSAARALLCRDGDLSRPEHRPLLERVRELFHDTADSMN